MNFRWWALTVLQQRFGTFVVFDVHSYNHRRAGPRAACTPEHEAPEVNIGTVSMNRRRWAPVVRAFCESPQSAGLDVRENVAFEGRGEQTRFIHDCFADSGCAIAIEFKKTFIDEWPGEPDRDAIARLKCVPVVLSDGAASRARLQS